MTGWGHSAIEKRHHAEKQRAARQLLELQATLNETRGKLAGAERELAAARTANEQAARVYDAVRDLIWRFVRAGDDRYLVTLGTVHRLVGAMVGTGQECAFRAADEAFIVDEFEAPVTALVLRDIAWHLSLGEMMRDGDWGSFLDTPRHRRRERVAYRLGVDEMRHAAVAALRTIADLNDPPETPAEVPHE